MEKLRTFQDVVIYCAGVEEFVKSWERLSGHTLLRRQPGNGLEAMIDRATGYDQWEPSDEAMAAFTEFVWDVVWCRLPDEAFEQPPA